MGPCGRLVIIRRTGSDGTHFPLCRNSCWFGRGSDCDIRIQLPVVSQQHCRIDVQQQEALLINFSTTNPTQLNGAPVNEPVKLKHGDIITIIDRSFRFECGSSSEGSHSAGYPEEAGAQEPLGHAEDAAESERPSSAKKKGIPPKARDTRPSSETELCQPKAPSRVLSETEAWTPKVSPRKRNRSLGLPQVSSSHVGILGDPMSEISENTKEEVSLKRRRVSFGGHLRPQLFDENLPPNTPLRRGEAPRDRRSLGTPAPTVLKKTGKEQSPAPREPEASPNVLGEVETASTSNVIQPPRLNTPRRRSSKGSARRKSVDKNTLKIIYPKRRSGAPKGTFSGGRSWADIVKLGTKKQDTKLVKKDSQRHRSKKPRQNATAQKPPDHIENPFSTGHANSPCTIVIGRAQVGRVSAPARPYRMLNHLVLHKTSNLTEDFSGLTEMFKTPGKEKPQRSSTCPRSFQSSEAISEEGNLREIPPMLAVPRKGPLATEQGAEVEDISPNTSEHKPEPGAALTALETWLPHPAGGLAQQEDLGSMEDQVSAAKSPRESLSGDPHRENQSIRKCTPKSQATLRTSPRLSRDHSASLELVEELASRKEQAAAPGSSRKSMRGDGHRKTPKRTSVSEETPSMSPRLLRSPGVRQEVVEEMSEMKDHMPTPKSQGQSLLDKEVPVEMQKTLRHSSKSGQTPRLSLRLPRNLGASLEFGEDLSGMKDCMPTPDSPVESNNNAARVAQSTPKLTPKSGTPRVTPRLLRSLGASPMVEEDMSEITEHMPALETPEEPISDGVPLETPKTPKYTPKSGQTPRMSWRLTKSLVASPEFGEDLSGMKGYMLTPESPEQSSNAARVAQSTPKLTPKSGTPRVTPRLLRSLGASPMVEEDVSEITEHMPALETPEEPISDGVPLETPKTPKYTPKSGQTPRMSRRLTKSLVASPEFGEDLSGMKGYMLTPESPEQSSNAARVAQSTPKLTPKSGTPRVTPRLLRSLGASPMVEEDVSEITEHMPALETPEEPISDGVPLETPKTPKYTPKSGQTPRMSRRLTKSLVASPEFGEDLSGMKGYMLTPESPEQSSNAVRVAQSPPKRTPKSGGTPRVTPRLLRSLGVNAKVEDDLSEVTEHMPALETPREPTSDEVYLEIEKTPKHPPISGEMLKTTPRLLRNSKGASPETGGNLARMRTLMPMPGSPKEPISDEEVHSETQQTPKLTRKSKGTPRMSLRLQRSLGASPEVGEDPSERDHRPTPEPAGESADVTGIDLGTPKRTPESAGTPRMIPRLVRSLGVSPEVTEDPSDIRGHRPALEIPGESLSDVEVQKTPRHSSQSGGTGMSPHLLRNSSAGPEVMEDPSRMKGHVPTPKSPREPTRDGAHVEIQKTPRRTPKSRPTPRTSLRLLRDSSTSLEVVEDLPGMDDCKPALSSPGVLVSDGKIHRGTLQTPEHTPGSEGTPRVSSRLLRRSLGASPEIEHFPGMERHLPAPESPGESVDEEVHLDIQDVGKDTPEPRGMSGKSLSACKGAHASPRVVEDVSRAKEDVPTSSPRGQRGDVMSMVQGTPELTRKSRGTPRVTPRPPRGPHASPVVGEDLSRMNDHTATLKPPAEPVSDKGTHLEAQQTPKPTPRSARTPRMSLRLLRSLGASPEVGEGLPQASDHMPTPKSPGQSVRVEIHRDVREPPEHTPKSGELPRMSPRVCNDMPTPALPETLSGDVPGRGRRTPRLSPKSGETPRVSPRPPRSLASPEVGDAGSETNDPDGEVRQEILKTPTRTPKPRGTPRLLRDCPADPEFEEDLSRQKGCMPTPKSPGDLISGEETHLEAQPELTPISGETPRMSLRLRRSLGTSPEVRKTLSEMSAPGPTAEAAGESSGDLPRTVQRTPKLTPQSGAASALRRSLDVSSELEGLPRRSDHMPTPEPPGQSVSDAEGPMDTPKTPRFTPKSRGTPRMSPRVWGDPNANPEAGEDLASMKERISTYREPAGPAKQEPDSLASPTGRSLPRSSRKIEPEPRETLTLELSDTLPPALQPEPQAVGGKLGTAPSKGPERLRGSTKQPRSSPNQSAPAAEPAGFKTHLRARNHPYERVGGRRGPRSLQKAPSKHPEESAVFPKEDASLLTAAQHSQGGPPSREGPGADSGLQRAVDTCVEASAPATKTKGRPGVSGEQASSSSLCEEEFQANASEKVQPVTVEDHGVPQGTRFPRRNRGRGESQESEHPPHRSAETEVKAEEPSTSAKPRQGTRCPRRNKRGTELQEPEHPSHLAENMEAEMDVKAEKPSTSAKPRQGTRCPRRNKRGTELQESETQESEHPPHLAENMEAEADVKTAEPSDPAKPRQGTRCPRRNKRGRELQESEHPPHQSGNMEAETDVKAEEPSTPAKPRQGTRCPRRNKRGGEPQESEHPPQQSGNMEAEMDVKMAEPSTPAKPRQGTRCPRRNKRGVEPQESEHPPQQSGNMEAETDVKMAEPSAPAKPRQGTRCSRRNKRGGEPQESEHPSQQSGNMEAETDVKVAEPSAPANLPQETMSVRSRRGRRANQDMQEAPQLPPAETGPASQDGKKSLEDGASEEEAVAGRPRGRSRRAVTNSAEALPMEEQVDEKPRRCLRGKVASTGGEKTAVGAPRKAGALSAAWASDKVLPAEVPEPTPPARRAARAAVSKEKPVDTVLAERATRRGLRSRHGPTPLGPHEMADAGQIPQETGEESGVKPRQRPGRAAPPSPPLPTIREEASGDKDDGDTELPDGSAPEDTQHRGARARLKLRTEPARRPGGAPSTDTKRPGEATGASGKAGRTQKGAAAEAPSLRSGRQVKAPLTTASALEAAPTPGPDSAPSAKRAKKSADEEVTRPAPRSSRLRLRNPPGPDAEPDREEEPATKPSQTQSIVSSRQRAAARSSKRRVPAETATRSPQQENATPPKRMRTRGNRGHADA